MGQRLQLLHNHRLRVFGLFRVHAQLFEQLHDILLHAELCQQLHHVLPHPSYGSGCASYSGSYSIYGSSTRVGGTTFHNYSSSDGGYLSGTTIRSGNTSYTSLYGW